MNGIVQAVAFAIYSEFSRERDPRRAWSRFCRLPDHTRESFEQEAKAALRVAEAHFTGVQTA